MTVSESVSSRSFTTLNELFLGAVGKHPKPDAFLSKSGGSYRGVSSTEALKKVATLARSLDRLGVRRGDRVAILAENRLEWALTDYAILGLGAVVVPIYPTLLAFVGGAAILVLLMVVLPRFGALFVASGSALPASTSFAPAMLRQKNSRGRTRPRRRGWKPSGS